MAQLPPQKRKKRRIQLREAQRRRRARLKEDQMTFLQLILDQDTMLALRNYSRVADKPMHICAADLLNAALAESPGEGATGGSDHQPEAESPTLGNGLAAGLAAEEGDTNQSGQHQGPFSTHAGQLDLF